MLGILLEWRDDPVTRERGIDIAIDQIIERLGLPPAPVNFVPLYDCNNRRTHCGTTGGHSTPNAAQPHNITIHVADAASCGAPYSIPGVPNLSMRVSCTENILYHRAVPIQQVGIECGAWNSMRLAQSVVHGIA